MHSVIQFTARATQHVQNKECPDILLGINNNTGMNKDTQERQRREGAAACNSA